ncbi:MULTISPECIES: serine hydrolase [Rhodococcus]|uniref:serine hydrolase n=1 Tax=Rhodococcus TaxID=1827 RepID=UPI0007AE79DD|nr:MULTISPECIES: serine hydrolase [Rhodococcus]KZL29927.1 serine hydrolase [Rhodococcus qingshengii]MBQ9051178.1 serine hydrolase [Rhodococcus sp. (in: high G+C Gram-positive bacteria)]MCE4160590.1 serine hydrolase [Rhodococcus sp. Ni2]
MSITSRNSSRLSAAAVPVVLTVALLAGCSSDSDTTSAPGPVVSDASPGLDAGVPIPDGQIDDAVGKLDGLANDLMASSGVPGMAVAVVHGGKTVYAKGFGVRELGNSATVDADTVFQLASVSKSVGATVVAHEVGIGTVDWDTPVISKLPGFALADPWVTDHLTISDLYTHRSGLPDHAGDGLEDLGYNRAQVLEKLRQLPLNPFRITYEYTNFGVTAGAEAVAAAAGTDWETLSQNTIYGPLGMTSTSSRFADYQARENRTVGHILEDGKYKVGPVRDADAQSPAGGVSSSVNDMAKWLDMVLSGGRYQGQQVVQTDALVPAVNPEIVSRHAQESGERSGFYGYGFNVSDSAAGRVTASHSGAFLLGAGTNFVTIPSADVGIVVLTNGTPTGVAETLTAEFADLVQFGKITREWRPLYEASFASQADPEGELAGKTPPASPAPAPPTDQLTGDYGNPYWGPALVTQQNGALTLTMGPAAATYPLTHWDGNTFTFPLSGENAPAGTVSMATFDGNSLTLEYFDHDHLGTFIRATPAE